MLRFNALHFAMLMVRDFLAQHALAIAVVAAIAVVIVLPRSAKAAIWNFVTRTLPGQFLMAFSLGLVCAWLARGYIDDAARRTADLRAQQQRVAQMAAQAHAYELALDEARRQAAATDRLLADARSRASDLDDQIAAYQQMETDYEAQLARRPAADRSDVLDCADLIGLQRAARVFGPVDAAVPAACARKLRKARTGP